MSKTSHREEDESEDEKQDQREKEFRDVCRDEEFRVLRVS